MILTVIKVIARSTYTDNSYWILELLHVLKAISRSITSQQALTLNAQTTQFTLICLGHCTRHYFVYDCYSTSIDLYVLYIMNYKILT